ncbi:NlpC/P60 family protein [Massilia aurea]
MESGAKQNCVGITMPLDIQRYTAHLRTKAKDTSQKRCAQFVREALAAGGASTHGIHPIHAKDWGPTLLRLGFHPLKVENSDAFIPLKGDVVVIQPYPKGNVSGHIAAYDGRIWICDFKQRDFWSGPTYRKLRPPHVFYRP